MKETDFNEAKESKEENIDVKELLFKYLIHWPWFVGAVIACLIAAWVYLYMSTPVYNISATVLIKDDKKGGGAGMSTELENLGLDGLISSSQNIDNEIEVLRSKTIAKEGSKNGNNNQKYLFFTVILYKEKSYPSIFFYIPFI